MQAFPSVPRILEPFILSIQKFFKGFYPISVPEFEGRGVVSEPDGARKMIYLIDILAKK